MAQQLDGVVHVPIVLKLPPTPLAPELPPADGAAPPDPGGPAEPPEIELPLRTGWLKSEVE
jgi:hypothetical protein